MTMDIFYHPESNLFTCQIPELLVKPVIPTWDHSDFKIEPISQPRDELISRFVILRVSLDSLKDFINILFSIWTQSSKAAKFWGFLSRRSGFSKILGFSYRGMGIFKDLGVFLFPRFLRDRFFFVGLDIPPKTTSGLKGRIGLVDGARVKIKSAYLTKIGFLVSDSSCSFLFRSCQ